MGIVHTLKAATNTVMPMNHSEDLTLSNTGGLELRKCIDAAIVLLGKQYSSRQGTNRGQRYFDR